MGLSMLIEQEGTGEADYPGNYDVCQLRGYLLDGTLFDNLITLRSQKPNNMFTKAESTVPLPVNVGMRSSNPRRDEGLMLLKNGAKS